MDGSFQEELGKRSILREVYDLATDACSPKPREWT